MLGLQFYKIIDVKGIKLMINCLLMTETNTEAYLAQNNEVL